MASGRSVLVRMHTAGKGTVLVECGKLLQRGVYKIKVLNTINFKKSMHYNPFAYIRSEKDILKLVNTIIANTKGDGEKSGEDFWVKSERLFYCALIGYIWYEAPEDEKNFTTLLEMINASEAREDDPEFQSPVDLMFERLEEKDPEHFAVRQYKKFLLSAGKTRSSILISCGARLAPFDIRELRELLETDEMELDTLGDRKTALFVIISDTDDTFNFVVSIFYTQLFNLLCDKADDVYGGRLPVHVRCLLDEFANIGQIPKFEKLIATIRSREISASIILQSQSQLKAIYKDNADTIVGNCDTTLFLGGKEKSTLKEISEILGKETIDSFNTSETRGRELSHGMNYQKLGKELVYGYIVTEHKLKENLQTGVLPVVLYIRKVAGRDKHFVAYFLAALFPVRSRFLYRCSKSLEVVFWYWSFCHIHSPSYILLFPFSVGYVYTVLSVSQNNSYVYVDN